AEGGACGRRGGAGAAVGGLPLPRRGPTRAAAPRPVTEEPTMPHGTFSWGPVVLSLSLGLTAPARGTAQDEPTAAQRAQLEKQARELNERVLKLQKQGRLQEATAASRQVLELRRRLDPDGPRALAAALVNLGFLLKLQQQYAPAEASYRPAR